MTDDKLVECPVSEHVPLTDPFGGDEIKFGPPPDWWVNQIREQEKAKYEKKLAEIKEREKSLADKKKNGQWVQRWEVQYHRRWFARTGTLVWRCGRCYATFSEEVHPIEIAENAKKHPECPKCGHSITFTFTGGSE